MMSNLKIAGAAALVIGFGLAWYVLGFDSARARRSPDTTRLDAPSVPGVLSNAERQSVGRTGDREPTSPSPNANTDVPVAYLVVRERGTGAPVGAAVVEAFPLAAGIGFLRTGADLIGSGLTGADGFAVVPLDRYSGEAVFRVERVGYIPAEVSIEWPAGANDQGNPLEVSLDVGESIDGRMVDAKGKGVAGLKVAVVSAGLPAHIGRQVELRPSGAASAHAVRTGPNGEFSVRGLRRGKHRIVVAEDGWQIAPSRYMDDPSRSYVSRSIFDSGESNAEIRVEAVRAYRVKVVDAATGAPVDDRFAMFAPVGGSPQAPIHIAGERFASFQVLGAMGREDPSTRAPGTYVGMVALAPSTSSLEQLRVGIQAVGCRPATTTVRLLTPAKLLSSRSVDVVRLEPTGQYTSTGSLSIVARRTAPQGAGLRGPAAYITGICGKAPLGFLLASTSKDGTYTFSRVPAGDLKLRFSDGLSTSKWFDLTLHAGESVEHMLSMPRPTGVELELREPGGQRVFGAEAVSYRAKGDSGGTLLYSGATRFLVAPNGELARNLIPFEPGTYTISASKSGIGAGTVTVEVESGRVSIAKLRLGTE